MQAVGWCVHVHHVIARLFFIVECGIMHFLCAVHVFEVWASSSSARLSLCQMLFFFVAIIAELAHGEKSRTYSLSRSPRLIDAPGTMLSLRKK